VIYSPGFYARDRGIHLVRPDAAPQSINASPQGCEPTPVAGLRALSLRQ
jgi:hypothetical protein